MALKNPKEFLARQLNDHTDSPSGICKKTFHEWGEGHICDALELALCYAYSLIPNEFTSTKTLTLKKDSKILDFSCDCEKFIALICIELPDGNIVELAEKDAEVRDLMPFLKNKCTEGSTFADGTDSLTYDNVDGSKDILLFTDKVPAGANIMYTCAEAPDLDTVSDSAMAQFTPLIAEYALWWLFRTDSESRSSLDRARLHFEGVKDFVTTKLLLEFSLKEDDYSFGRRKVDDS